MKPTRDEVGVIEIVHFPGNAGALEGRLHYPEEDTPATGVVIAGPHPLLGGDLENNVVAGLAVGLARRGLAVLSFNYRGVGGSEGEPPDVAAHLAEFWATSHVPDEPAFAADLASAVAFLREVLGESAPVALAGYSFGCSLLPAAAPPAAPLALIAPTVGTHDYEAYARCPNPLLVVAPEGDFAADAARLAEWFAGLAGPKWLVRGWWDDHFFRGYEDRLAETVFAFFREQGSDRTWN